MGNKGTNFESQIARWLKEFGFPDAERHLEFQAEHAVGRDLDGTQPFAIQAKCYKSTPSISVIDEIQHDPDYPLRVVWLKRTRSKGTSTLHVVGFDAHVAIAMMDILEQNGLLDDVVTYSEHIKENM